MLCKLAFGNVRRAGRDYLVYLLTLTLATCVFYTFNTISLQTDVAGIDPAFGASLQRILSSITIFLAAVMGFLMVYANSFIMRRRKKELGLYQILGMGRGQVALVMALETAFVTLAAFALGIVAGVGLSQLMVFFTASMFKMTVSSFRFIFSPGAALLTAGCMAAVFLVTLLFNLRAVAKSKVIELVAANCRNEEVRTGKPLLSAAIFVVGAALTGIAYHRLLRDGIPMQDDPAEWQAFAITTALVIAGTALLFFGLSGFLLKALQSARGLYWRGLNMFTLRQLSAKVNTVCLSMAMISMILFLAITSVTTGMSVANAISSMTENSTPADYSRSFAYYGPQQTAAAMNGDPHDSDASAYRVATEPVDLMKASEQDVILGKDGSEKDGKPFDLASVAGKTLQINTYDARPREGAPAKGSQTGAPAAYVTLAQLAKEAGSGSGSKVIEELSGPDEDSTSLAVMSASGYNRYRAFRGLEPVDLGEDGYALTTDMGEALSEVYDAVLSQGVEVDIAGIRLKPAVDKVDPKASAWENGQGTNQGTVIVPDRVIEHANLPLAASYLLVDYKDGMGTEKGDAYVDQDRLYGPTGAQAQSIDDFQVGYWVMGVTRTAMVESNDTVNALISYLAIYIGFVLVVAAAAILTIQQLSGVADASRSYRTLSELGAPTPSIQRSVLVQQAVFFLSPLAVAIAHSVVALHVITDLVRIFGGMDIGAMVWLACAIFAICYGGYFALTNLMSRGMVREAVRAR